MTIPIKLYHPLNTLKPVAENIWVVDGGIVEMDMKVANVPFSTRMTIIRLSNNHLWCHSPIEPTEELIQALKQLGEVCYLIGPNKLHYAHIDAWKKYYPKASVWLAPGVVERAKSQHIPLPTSQDLADHAPVDWSEEIEQHLFKGSRYIEEAVFFHKTSETLILTDLIENIETEQMNPFHKLIFKIGNNAYPNGKTPRDLRMTFVGRKKEAQASFQVLQNWQPKNIILAHGQCHIGNGEEVLKQAFKWVK